MRTMMSSSSDAAVLVTQVKTDADEDGVVATVVLQRFPTGLRPFGPRPKAADMPQDLRDALRAWLDAAHPTNPQEQP